MYLIIICRCKTTNSKRNIVTLARTYEHRSWQSFKSSYHRNEQIRYHFDIRSLIQCTSSRQVHQINAVALSNIICSQNFTSQFQYRKHDRMHMILCLSMFTKTIGVTRTIAFRGNRRASNIVRRWKAHNSTYEKSRQTTSRFTRTTHLSQLPIG